jgi:hypothetical protein
VADSTLRSKVTRLKRGATFLLFDAFHRAAWAFCPLLKKKLLNFPGTSAWLPSGCPSGTKGSVQLTASTKTERDLREDRDGRKSGRQETAGTTHR